MTYTNAWLRLYMQREKPKSARKSGSWVRQQASGQAMGWAQRNSKRRLKLSEQKLVRRGIPTLLTLTNKYI